MIGGVRGSLVGAVLVAALFVGTLVCGELPFAWLWK